MYIYQGTKYGFSDSGGLACLTKQHIPTLYKNHYPESRHKLPDTSLAIVRDILAKSYVDDIIFGATAPDPQNEITTPTFKHPPNYQNMSLELQADYCTISRGSQIVHVLDFCGHNMKLFQSNSAFV